MEAKFGNIEASFALLCLKLNSSWEVSSGNQLAAPSTASRIANVKFAVRWRPPSYFVKFGQRSPCRGYSILVRYQLRSTTVSSVSSRRQPWPPACQWSVVARFTKVLCLCTTCS